MTRKRACILWPNQRENRANDQNAEDDADESIANRIDRRLRRVTLRANWACLGLVKASATKRDLFARGGGFVS